MADYNFRIKGTGQLDVSNITSSLSKVEKAFSGIKVNKKLENNFRSVFNSLKQEIDSFNEKMQGSFKNKGDVSALENSAKKISLLFSQLETDVSKAYSSLSAKGAKGILQLSDSDTKKVQELDRQIKQVESSLKNLSKQKIDLNNLLGNFQTSKAAESARKIIETYASGAEGSLESALKQIDTAIQRQQSAARGFGQTNNIQANINSFEQLRTAILNTEQESGNLNNKLNSLQSDKAQVLNTAFQNLQNSTRAAADSLSQTKNSVEGTTSSLVAAKQAQQEFNSELEQLKTRTTYFFSLQNGVNLFKKAVSDAFNTVKTLDKAMTETAVVTDFSVGDMWDQLPKYTELADQLGASIQGAYETMTLYYQQGLDMNQTFQIGTETMKMARIAGMDYAESTNLMTAALRGFNMELNDTSAKRINDVYSELAAITASDTQEIATAMTKTASIASSANMEFETTAAFLAQMIETTREPAENLGTAMKTIIARFQEMKSAPEDTFDVDGETVSVNKVETALKSVGVQLRDTKGQFRDLDDVFLDLAKRWDSLDIMQQRYVATTAAGSRQQSRFIAMMSNYDRVMELVGSAYDSAGSSDKQFEKTLDSLEAKLNRLSSAWQQFTMGIANSSFIKAGVDFLTSFLTIVNNLTEKLGTVGGAIAKIGVAWGTLKLGKAGFNGIFSMIGKTMGLAGTQAGQQFQQNFSRSISKISLKEGAQLKTLAVSLQKEIGSTDFINISSLQQMFSKIPATLQAEVMKAAPQTVTALSTSLEESLRQNIGSTDDEVLAWVQRIKEQFEKDLQTVGLDKALQNAMTTAGQGIEVQSSIPGLKTLVKAEGDWTGNMSIKSADAQQLADAMGKISSATGAAGSALMNFSNILNQLGLEKAASLVGTFGSALMSLGGVISSVMSMISILGGGVTLVLALITAVTAGIIALAIHQKKVAESKTVEARLEKAQKATENAKESANEAEEAYNELLSAGQSYTDLRAKLDDLTEGAQAWTEALLEANAAAIELAQDYPELAGMMTRDENGVLGFKEGALEDFYAQKQQKAGVSSIAQNIAQIKEEQLTYEKTISNLGGSAAGSLTEWFEGFTGVLSDVITDYSPTDGEGKQIVVNTAEEMAQALYTTMVQSMADADYDTEKAKKLFAQRISDDGMNIYDSSTGQYLKKEYEGFVNDFFTNYSGYDTKASKAALDSAKQVGAQWSAIITQSASDTLLKSDYSSVVQDYFSKIVPPEDFIEAVEKQFSLSQAYEDAGMTEIDPAGQGELDNLQKLYSNLTGIALDSVKEQYDEEEDLIEQIKSVWTGTQIQDAMQGQMDKLVNVIETSKMPEALTKLMAVLTGDGSTLTAEEFQAYSSGVGLSKAAIESGYSTGEIAEALGFDDRISLYNAVKQAIPQIQQQYIDNLEKFANMYAGFNTQKDLTDQQTQASFLAEAQRIDPQDWLKVMETAQSIQLNLGEEGAGSYFNTMFEALSSDNEELASDLDSIFGSIDYSNPIEAFREVTAGAESSEEAIAAVGQKILEAGQQSFSAGEQFKYFLNSADYEDLAEDIEKAKEENGKLTADNIKDLAEGSQTLTHLMDNLNMSAKTTADIFNAIDDGRIGLDDITDSMVKLLEATNQFDNTIDNTLSLIENFDPGRDEGKVGEFVQSLTESVEEMWKNGEYGNTQLQNYLKLMFGEDAWNKALSDAGGNLERAETGFVKRLGVIEDNLYGAWDDLARNYKKSQDKASEALGKKLSVTLGKDNDIILDVGQATTEETVQWLADAYQVSEEYAEMMLTDFANYSADLQKELKLNDWNAGIADYVTSKQEEGAKVGAYTSDGTTGKAIFSDKEVQSISATTGKSTEQVWSDIYTQMTGVETEFQNLDQAWQSFASLTEKPLYFDLLDDDGIMKVGDELQSALTEGFQASNPAVQNWIDQFAQDFGGKTESINYETASSFLSSIGVASDQIPSIIQQAAENSDLKIHINGEDVDASELPTKLEQAAAEAQYGAAAQVFANAIVEAFTSATGIGQAVTDQMTTAGESGKTAIQEDINSIDGSTLQSVISSSIGAGAQAGVASAQSAINSLRGGTVQVGVNFKLNKSGVTTSSGSSVSFSLYAEGSKGIKNNEIGILGDGGGPELLISKNGIARLVGENGPEAARLKTGDQILTAEETRAVFSGNETSTYRAFAQGYRNPNSQSKGGGGSSKSGTGSGGSGSSGSSSDSTEEWKNDYDWLYNLTEDINEQLRIREKLEKRYSRILRDETKSISDLAQNIYSQIDSLEAQRKLQQEMYDNRKFEMEEALKAYSDISDYATYNWKDNTIEIDWGKIDEVTDSELGDRIDEYIGHLERIQDAMDDAEDSLDDIIDEIQDLKDEGKDEYSSFEQKVMEAYIQREQEKIDALSDLDSNITDANSKLLSSIQSNLDKIRQERDNQKTEQDLAEKERRLAYLRQDTSGANALEIKKLEKELQESRQDYTDSLIDQKISELQEQNDRASEERQQQIELLQAQLDYNQKNGEYWPLVYSLIMTGVNDQSQLVKGSELEALFHNSDEWDGMSGIQKMAWLEEINQEIKEGFAWLMRNSDAAAIARQYENSFDKNTDYQAIINKAIASGDYLTAAYAEQRRNAKIDALGLDQEKTFKYQKYLSTYDKNIDYQAKINEAIKQGDYLSAAMYEQQRNAKIAGEGRKEGQTHYYEMYLTGYGLDLSKYDTSTIPTPSSSPSTPSSDPENDNSSTVVPRVGSKVSIKDTAKTYGGSASNVSIPNWVKEESKNGYTISAINSSTGEALIQEIYSWVKLSDLDLKEYKKGGLVSSTGLAWLDGTKSAPEMVLNSRDTENFIVLKDILSDLLKQSSGGGSGDSGEVTINVDIKVDKISDDYDVDRMVERVKKSINQDARYRNINALNRLSR